MAKSHNSENAWLGREDSNLRMAESKSAALPLGYAPTRRKAGWARRKTGGTIVWALPHRNGCPEGFRSLSWSILCKRRQIGVGAADQNADSLVRFRLIGAACDGREGRRAPRLGDD